MAGTDGGKESALAPDTGQSPADEHAEEAQAAAAGPASSTNNYNLVTSLLNLTKSPVRRFPLCSRHRFLDTKASAHYLFGVRMAGSW